MNTNIEKLQSETNEIRSALENLQKQAQNPETEKKKQELVAQAEEAKKQTESLLQTESDENARAQLEEIKTQLENYTSELQALSAEVKKSSESVEGESDLDTTSAQKNPQATENSAPEKAKGWRASTKDFTKEQWNHVWSKESRKTETGTNLARAAGFVGTGIGAFMLLKKGRDRAF